MKVSSIILATILQSIKGYDLSKDELYPAFSKRMALWGYDWEPSTVTTEDGYELTMFRITEKLTGEPPMPRDPSLPPVLAN